jgi:hypothetical protein
VFKNIALLTDWLSKALMYKKAYNLNVPIDRWTITVIYNSRVFSGDPRDITKLQMEVVVMKWLVIFGFLAGLGLTTPALHAATKPEPMICTFNNQLVIGPEEGGIVLGTGQWGIPCATLSHVLKAARVENLEQLVGQFLNTHPYVEVKRYMTSNDIEHITISTVQSNTKP